MKLRKNSIVKLLLCVGLFAGCSSSIQKTTIDNGHYAKDVFGDEYYSSGHFRDDHQDSVEAGTWMISDLTSPVVVYGDYSNGLLVGDWKLGVNDMVLSSKWSRCEITAKKCSFSLPFQYRESKLDSNYFRLRTLNDSVGSVSIIIGVDGISNKELNLSDFVENFEDNLKRQKYYFSKQEHEVESNGKRYFFNNYSMKDTVGKEYELYHFFGYTPSKKHFVELMLLHNGPQPQTVKIVYSLFSTSFYIDNERFFNPFSKKKD